jgi:hypothetical protein
LSGVCLYEMRGEWQQGSYHFVMYISETTFPPRAIYFTLGPHLAAVNLAAGPALRPIGGCSGDE